MSSKKKQVWDMGRMGKPPKPLPKGTVPPSFTMNAVELRAREIDSWSEKDFQQRVITLARSLGYTLIYHTHDSRRSQPGFPDLVLVSPRTKRILFRELKSATGRISPDQKHWGDTLREVGADFDFWYPKDWASGKIHDQLKGGDHA